MVLYQISNNTWYGVEFVIWEFEQRVILIVCLTVMISLIDEDIFYAIMNFVLCCIVIFDIGLYIDIFF